MKDTLIFLEEGSHERKEKRVWQDRHQKECVPIVMASLVSHP